MMRNFTFCVSTVVKRNWALETVNIWLSVVLLWYLKVHF